MVRKVGIETKQLEFTYDIHNAQFNYLGKFYLKLSIISSFTDDYSDVHARVNDGEDVERPDILTSTISQTDEDTFHTIDDHKFTFTLPKGFCKNDTSHDVYLLVEAYEADKNERLNKKVGEAKFAIYPRTNAPRIDLSVEPGEFMLYYTDVMTLLKTTSAQDIKMHCGRIKYSVSLREVHAMPYMDPPPISTSPTPFPRTARTPSPVYVPPPQPKRVAESPKQTDRRHLDPDDKNQTARSEAMVLAKDSTNPADRTLDPQKMVEFPPASPSVQSEATMRLAPESPVESLANIRDLSEEAPDMFRHVSRPNYDSFTIVFHGAISVPAVSDGSTPMPFAIAKTKSDLDEKNKVSTVTHCGAKPTHTPTWEEVVTLDVPNSQISDELLMLAVADKKTKEIRVNYRLPVAHLVPFHHYHLELVMPAKGHANGIRLYTTIIRKTYTIPMDSSSPNYAGFEVLLRAVQRPFANPVGPITAVARIVADFPNYKRDLLDGDMKLAGITPTTIMFPSPHPNSFAVPPPVAQGYPQITGYHQLIQFVGFIDVAQSQYLKMDHLRAKASELEKLSKLVLGGLAAQTDLNDEDGFEVEYQLDNCLKALKCLKKLVGNRPLDQVDAAVSSTSVAASKGEPFIIPDTPDKPPSKSVQPSTITGLWSTSADAKKDDKTSPKFSEKPYDAKLSEKKKDKPEENEEEAAADVSAQMAEDDVLAAFMDDDEDIEWDNLDDSTGAGAVDAINLSDEDDDTEDVEDDPNVEPPSTKHKQVLKTHFGHKNFRPFQWSIINGVLNDKVDQCVIMATGYGKSLCYQYPSVYTGRTTVVVSPLISLMTDQVLALKMVNIPATYMGSAQENSAEARRKMMNGQYRIVYVTPEFVTAGGEDLLKQLNKDVGIDLIAIDEAHCVSQWGHDFRSCYQRLGFLKRTLPGVPILAVTATATPAVRKDICRSLNLVNPRMTCTSFDRKNLRFAVQQKVDPYTDLKSQMTRDSDGKWCFEGPTIVYCPTKKTTEEITDILRTMGVLCARYHAGLSMGERKRAHEDFVADRISCIVATVAFGMGIDKPDVRLIIHYGAPKDVESYYQETGRAGRDGGASACLAFYAAKDFNINRRIISDIQNKQFLDHKMEMLQKMQSYLSSTQCRRKVILRHFDAKAKSALFGTEDCCDNCGRKLEYNKNLASGVDNNNKSEDSGLMKFGELFDFGDDAKLMLDAINVFKQKFGLGAAVALLIGSTDKRAQWHTNSPLFGAGKHHSQKWWMTFGRMLLGAGYLNEERVQGGYGTTVSFTRKAGNWLNQNRSKPTLKMEPNHELLALQKLPKAATVAETTFETKILPTVPCNTWLSTKQLSQFAAPTPRQLVDGPDEKARQAKLYGELMKLRNTLAEEQGCAPYMVASNKNLLDLAKYRPLDLDNLAKLEDLPEVKQQKFGGKFVECVSKFCQDNSAEGNRGLDDETDHQQKEVSAMESSKFDEEKFLQMSETARTSYTMLEREKMTLTRVCDSRGIKASTVAGHMAQAIKLGLPVDIEKFNVTDQIQKLIMDTIRAPPINSDISKRTPIKEALPDHVTWEQLNIVLAILERQYGVAGGGKMTSPPSSGPSVSRKQEPSPTASSQDSQSGKRKLPTWLAAKSGSSAPALKKQKSNLFKR